MNVDFQEFKVLVNASHSSSSYMTERPSVEETDPDQEEINRLTKSIVIIHNAIKQKEFRRFFKILLKEVIQEILQEKALQPEEILQAEKRRKHN